MRISVLLSLYSVGRYGLLMFVWAFVVVAVHAIGYVGCFCDALCIPAGIKSTVKLFFEVESRASVCHLSEQRYLH